MTNKFTVKAQKALERAHSEACALGHTYIGSEHLLLGLAAEKESAASKLLSAGFILALTSFLSVTQAYYKA